MSFVVLDAGTCLCYGSGYAMLNFSVWFRLWNFTKLIQYISRLQAFDRVLPFPLSYHLHCHEDPKCCWPSSTTEFLWCSKKCWFPEIADGNYYLFPILSPYARYGLANNIIQLAYYGTPLKLYARETFPHQPHRYLCSGTLYFMQFAILDLMVYSFRVTFCILGVI